MIRRVRKISKKYYLRQIVSCFLVCYMSFGIPAQVAMASNPPASPTTVPSGLGAHVGADITDSATGWLEITQTDNEAIMNWNNFDIGSDATVEFIQPGVSAAVLNRVHDGDVSGIMGTLNANGRVFVINPAGIVFGEGAIINVAQLVASSLNLEDEDFLNGLPYEFTENPDFIDADDGIVRNESSDFQNAERLYLIGRQVINRGHLIADECVIMAAGDYVLISENSPVSVKVEMGDGWSSGGDLYQVRNEDGDGIEVGQGGEMETAQVILAAGDIWSAALVKASAGGSEAVATIDIDAAGDVTVTDEVVAEASSHSEGAAAAAVTVNSGGNVDVIAHVWKDGQDNWHGGEALIQAKTSWGAINTSEILICADGYLTVEAEGWFDNEWDRSYDSTASIQAIAQSGEGMSQNNTADVQIEAKQGIEVTAIGDFYTDASASIAAYAYGGAENTAGILACTEGDVQVIAERGGEAMIKSEAGAYRYQETSSDATTTVISHAGDVLVDSSLGGNASIKSVVYGGSTDTATTQIYATDVEVTGKGASISAGGLTPLEDGFTFCAATDGRIMQTDGSATLIVDGSQSQDCPDCPPCPCEEAIFAPAAPLYAPASDETIEGCGTAKTVVANTLGMTIEELEGVFAATPGSENRELCDMCARFIAADRVLEDTGGVRLAALAQVVNGVVQPDAPFTPEVEASIAQAFTGQAGGGAHYALAEEYLDALVAYVGILTDEVGLEAGDAIALVMEEHSEFTTTDNPSIAAYVAAQLAALGG